jgi:hypothetical protein
MLHYTDKRGYNGISSSEDWNFKVHQPKKNTNPKGAYFTTYLPDEFGLAVKLRISKKKLEFVFSFDDIGDLRDYPGNRGRLQKIFYSPSDYCVKKIDSRQRYRGVSSEFIEDEGGG